ncbi:M16 family metallopeptidase [Nakamurella leprariae]|uniref:Insulinase family protein n=1 Tax=Nakamurella leprariae TaxID=2803911 RepID=A0A938YB09_9ACTN|nr:pitrilysin family protein [Nakamurella leprariae]MBM9467312.1 insulinase family protein [Nakamurella leprariae]
MTLDNGLRVVLAPDRSTPVVGVSVHYDVGFRSEPKGRTGFAHLFEHLMFQGSESLPKLEHFRLVQSSGGVFNGSTHTDYTDYYEVLPSAALERGLFLEADRMRAPMITAENLANQVDVVSEEIRLNVLNRPYGGFPWILLPPVLFSTFANAHNGYGDFVDLQAATVEDCADFFETYYTPANAVLTVCGGFDPDIAADLVAAHFGDVPGRPAPVRPSFAEPWPTARAEQEHVDAHAPTPAVAVGWRVPDPVDDLHGYLASMLLGSVLSDGEASRLQSTVVADAGLATEIWAGPGLVGGPLDARDPDVFVLGAIHHAQVDADTVIDASVEQIARLVDGPPAPAELERAVARYIAGLYRDNDSISSRTRSLGAFELLHGRAELLGELPALLAAVTPDDIAAAARSLDPDRCAVLRVVPGGDEGQDGRTPGAQDGEGTR